MSFSGLGTERNIRDGTLRENPKYSLLLFHIFLKSVSYFHFNQIKEVA